MNKWFAESQLPPSNFPLDSVPCYGGYWTFGHNPSSYAKSVTCPALLLFGERDDRVSMEETQDIFGAMNGKKVLVTYPEAGHNLFTPENKANWVHDVTSFMADLPATDVTLSHAEVNLPYSAE